MVFDTPSRHGKPWSAFQRLSPLAVAFALLAATACASSTPAPQTAPAADEQPAEGTTASERPSGTATAEQGTSAAAESRPVHPDPRVGLAPGLFDAEQASWNMRLVSNTPPHEDFVGSPNSDLAFTGHYAIQGNYNGFMIWDISDPTQPQLVKEYLCPASQSDVSVYGDLLFVSGEGMEGRLDCGTQGVQQAASPDRLRGIRIFDISDIRNPEYIHNVQTCRGSHTHTVLEDPNDDEHIYIYVSGSAPVRPAAELAGCSGGMTDENPNTALFRIEVIRVPLADPTQAAIVSSPRIFEDLVAPPRHGLSPEDLAEIERARERGAFIVEIEGRPYVLSDQEANNLLRQVVAARGGEGPPTAADSAWLRAELPNMVRRPDRDEDDGPRPGPTQCHDITVYPAIGLAGGACEGYGILLDITDPMNPVRLDAVADSNFAYWHSATFNNDGDKVLFTDEWGGGGQPKCRANDPPEWGANAIFRIDGEEMDFASYYKLPAPQGAEENCVAHNGSLVPIPGRDVKVQGWYQGGVSVFEWTDAENPVEIAYFDRGPVDPERMEMAGSWSAYWYNGVIVSSEIARGLDILQLQPSEHLSENELEAARSVRLDYFNAQGQPKFEWPASYALARAYVDQLERGEDLSAERIASTRAELERAERGMSSPSEVLGDLADRLEREAELSGDPQKVRKLAAVARELTER